MPRRAQNPFLHASQVFIDQARESRNNILLKVGHVLSVALITAEKARLFDGVRIFYLSSLKLSFRDWGDVFKTIFLQTTISRTASPQDGRPRGIRLSRPARLYSLPHIHNTPTSAPRSPPQSRH
jgi:hypothetical protein